MNKFVVISLLIVDLSVDCFGLKCHFCKDSTNSSKNSYCPEGKETEVRECQIDDNYAVCSISSYSSGKRVGLGCWRDDNHVADSRHCRKIHSGRKPVLACDCLSDSCNIYAEDDIKYCTTCDPESGFLEIDLCSYGDLVAERPCPVGMKYCYVSSVNYPEKGERNIKRYRGCAKELPAENDKFTSENSSSCRAVLENGIRRTECYCASNGCTNLFDHPHLQTEMEDIDGLWCLVCTKGGVKDNVCAPGEEGESKRCPTKGMNYCKITWTSKPDGENRKYYKGCAKQLPAENDKFTTVNSASCRLEHPDNDVVKQECFCTTKDCNNKNFDDLPDSNAIKCLVCTRGVGEDNLCSNGEEGEAIHCPTGMKYCKYTFTSNRENNKYYKGCAKELPAKNDKFIVEVNYPNSVYCRAEFPRKGVRRQECYCASDVCNNHFEDIPEPVDNNDLECLVCTRGVAWKENNVCASGEEGERKTCPPGTKYCENRWIEHPGMQRDYHKGCVTELPAGKDKFKVTDSTFCRLVLPEKGIKIQECYCKSNFCNAHFDDLPTPKQDYDGFEVDCIEDGGVNTFPSVIVLPVILLHIIFM